MVFYINLDQFEYNVVIAPLYQLSVQHVSVTSVGSTLLSKARGPKKFSARSATGNSTERTSIDQSIDDQTESDQFPRSTFQQVVICLT